VRSRNHIANGKKEPLSRRKITTNHFYIEKALRKKSFGDEAADGIATLQPKWGGGKGLVCKIQTRRD